MEPIKTSKRSPDDRDKIIGRRIRSYREISGLNQAELGDLVGVTFQQIQKYEYGTNKVSVGRMLEICDALKISAINFLHGLTDTSEQNNHGTAPISIVSENAQKDIEKDPIASKETTELLRVYYSIKDPKKRKSVVKFIKESMTD